MTSLILPVPGLAGGITQNPPETADPGRVADLLNMVPIPKAGIGRRPGTRWQAEVLPNGQLDAMLRPIDFGGNDRYLAVLGHRTAKVFLRDGTEVPVWTVTRDADGAITGGTSPDFSYLNLRHRQLIHTSTSPPDYNVTETFEVAAGKWVISDDATAAVFGDASHPLSPLGFPEVSAEPGADVYTRLPVTAGAANFGRWRHNGITAHLWQRKWFIGTYISRAAAGAGYQECSTIRLIIQDPAAPSTEHTVAWDFSGASTDLPPVSSNAAGFRTFTERVDGTTDQYRIGFIFDSARAVGGIPGSPGNTIYSYIEVDDVPASGDPGSVFAWGFMLWPDPEADRMPDYALPPEGLRTVTAGATTFIGNPLVPTRLTATTSESFASVYPSITFTGDPGPKPIATAWYIFFKFIGTTTGAGSAYTITVTVTDTVGAGGTKTLTHMGTWPMTRSTQIEATAAAAAINADINNTDGTGRIVECFSDGAMVKLVSKDNSATSKWEITEVKAVDAEGDSLILTWSDSVDDLSDVPRYGSVQDGHVLKLVEVDSDKDDFQVPQVVLRFIADIPDTFGPGRWEEGTDYSLRTELDGSTLPHTLVRRMDNSVGTVTGESRALYFEWAEHTWDDRAVGDDLTNPYPSFITPPEDEELVDRFVDALSFYANRLVLGSGLNIAFSETNLYGNFWRSLLQTLPDSDRVDVAISTPDAARILDITNAAGSLFVRTPRGILAVTYSGVFGPRSIGLETVYAGSTGPIAVPVAALGGLFVPGDRADTGGPVFLFPAEGRGDSSLSLGSQETVEDVPYLLQPRLHTLDWAGALSTLYVHSRDDDAAVYALRFTRNQAAWHRYDCNGARYSSVASLSGDLFALIRRSTGLHLESLPLDELPRDGQQLFHIPLDRRLTEQDLATPPALSGSNTVFTLPYVTEGTLQATLRDGTLLSKVGQTASSLTVAGDQTAKEVFIGETFISQLRPLRPILREQGITGPVPMTTIQQYMKKGFIATANTGFVQAVVTDFDGRSYTQTFEEDAPSNCRYEFAVPTELEHFDLLFTTSSHKPLTLVGLEWLIEAEDEGERVSS